jgi:hypothetical protein
MDDGFGKIIIIFLVVLFFIWLLTGGPNHQGVNQPYEKPYTEKIHGAFAD